METTLTVDSDLSTLIDPRYGQITSAHSAGKGKLALLIIGHEIVVPGQQQSVYLLLEHLLHRDPRAHFLLEGFAGSDGQTGKDMIADKQQRIARALPLLERKGRLASEVFVRQCPDRDRLHGVDDTELVARLWRQFHAINEAFLTSMDPKAFAASWGEEIVSIDRLLSPSESRKLQISIMKKTAPDLGYRIFLHYFLEHEVFPVLDDLEDAVSSPLRECLELTRRYSGSRTATGEYLPGSLSSPYEYLNGLAAIATDAGMSLERYPSLAVFLDACRLEKALALRFNDVELERASLDKKIVARLYDDRIKKDWSALKRWLDAGKADEMHIESAYRDVVSTGVPPLPPVNWLRRLWQRVMGRRPHLVRAIVRRLVVQNLATTALQMKPTHHHSRRIALAEALGLDISDLGAPGITSAISQLAMLLIGIG